MFVHSASKPIAFTYGRFGERGGAKVFKILDADRELTTHYLDTVYLSGDRSPKTNRPDSSRYGRVIDTYDLTGKGHTLLGRVGW